LRSGTEHAEIVALNRAGFESDGSTLYVTLEPCTHHGKTPPCVNEIVSRGVRRVVIGTLDPDPRVNGRGVEMLRANGLEVEVGCLEDQAILLNLPYFKLHLGLGITMTLKVAMTMDGRIASGLGRRDRITGEDAQAYTHRLRASHKAVLIGVDTLLTDMPKLDCRLLEEVMAPVPVVLDTKLRIPERYPWVEEGREFLVCCSPDVDAEKRTRIEKSGGKVFHCRAQDGELELSDVVGALEAEGLSSVLVEGGGRIFSSFVERGCWDAMYVFISPSLFGEEGVAMYRRRIANENTGAFPVDASRVGGEFLLRFLNMRTREGLLARLT
jgi:diaminohydroxyphosphoribosylaminopyrimidine deaminase/5-amino-6-(5-phosphoribosylamino)uracil reductase